MLAALCAFTAVLFAFAAIAYRPQQFSAQSVARLSTMERREILQESRSEAPIWERLLWPLLAAISLRVKPRWAGLSLTDIRQAGIDTQRFGVTEVMAAKVLCGLTGAGIAIAISLLYPGAFLLLPVATFSGFIAPSIYISRRRARRRAQMLRELPDLVGLLKAFVAAGVPVEQALHLISAQQSLQEPPNLLAGMVRRSLSDYGLGMSIDAALESMADRSGLEELNLLASALSQGKRQGAGMERILRDQEQVVRLQQRNRATAEASRVSTRLVGILVLIYLPEFMLLIMIPLFYGIFLRAFT